MIASRVFMDNVIQRQPKGDRRAEDKIATSPGQETESSKQKCGNKTGRPKVSQLKASLLSAPRVCVGRQPLEDALELLRKRRLAVPTPLLWPAE
jgi:hypothetical protein